MKYLFFVLLFAVVSCGSLGGKRRVLGDSYRDELVCSGCLSRDKCAVDLAWLGKHGVRDRDGYGRLGFEDRLRYCLLMKSCFAGGFSDYFVADFRDFFGKSGDCDLVGRGLLGLYRAGGVLLRWQCVDYLSYCYYVAGGDGGKDEDRLLGMVLGFWEDGDVPLAVRGVGVDSLFNIVFFKVKFGVVAGRNVLRGILARVVKDCARDGYFFLGMKARLALAGMGDRVMLDYVIDNLGVVVDFEAKNLRSGDVVDMGVRNCLFRLLRAVVPEILQFRHSNRAVAWLRSNRDDLRWNGKVWSRGR